MEPFELYEAYIDDSYREAMHELFAAIDGRGTASSAGINRLVLGDAYRSGGRPLGVIALLKRSSVMKAFVIRKQLPRTIRMTVLPTWTARGLTLP